MRILEKDVFRKSSVLEQAGKKEKKVYGVERLV
jgi:hypothetical protein